MDLSGLLLSQNLEMPSQQQGFLEGEDNLGAGKDGFGDLLGLVESLEVAESGENLESADLLKSMVDGVADPESDFVLGQKAASLARLQEGSAINKNPAGEFLSSEEAGLVNSKMSADIGTEIGTEIGAEIGTDIGADMRAELGLDSGLDEGLTNATSQLNAGKIVGHHVGDEMTFQSNVAEPRLSAELFSRSAQASLALNSAKGQSAEKLGMEQVAAWSQGLSSGEIKSVDLQKSPDVFQMQKQQASSELQQDLKTNAKLPDSFDALQRQSRSGQEQRVVDANAKLHKSFDASEAPQMSGKSELVTQQRSESHQAKNVQLNANVASGSADSGFSEGRSDSGDQDSQSGESQFARDFLLGRSMATETSKTSSTSTALKTPEISSEVVDFVADRVNHLQKVGGESLRVKMDSSGLGELEIKVTVRKGVVDVSIRSDAEGATSALKSSGAELKAKLEQVVDLGDLDISTGIAEKQALRIGAQASKAQLGADFANLGAEVVDGAEFGLKDSSKSNDSGSFDRRDGENSSFSQEQNFSQGGDREEKRDEAMDQWRNVFESRKTA